MNKSGRIKRFYDKEEIELMNVIFGKNIGNNWFSRDELVFANEVNLSDFDLAQVRMEWKNSFAE